MIFRILAEGLAIENGGLNPTSKVRRASVTDQHQAVISDNNQPR